MKKYSCFLLLFVLILFASCQKSSRPDRTKIRAAKELNQYVGYGWNTWSNSNLMEYILLPEELMLKVSFRVNYRTEIPATYNETYIPAAMESYPMEIIPIAHNYDGHYTELRIKWKGMTALIQSVTHHDDIFILFTPEELPSSPHIMILEAGMLYNSDGEVIKNGHYLQANMKTRTHNIGSTQKDTAISLPISNPYLSFNTFRQIAFFTGEKRSLDYIGKFVERRKNEFYNPSSEYGDCSEIHSAMQTLLGWNFVYDPLNKRVITPVSRRLSEAWGGWVLYGWNTYFNAAMYATDNKFMAYSTAINISKEITPDGFVPNYSGPFENGKSYDRSQPPVGSMICKLIYDKYPEKWFLEEVYPSLLSWNRWWPENRDNGGYLSWGSNPKKQKDISNVKQAALMESGTENSPLFDSALFNENTHKLELASVGLMSLYISDCKKLAEISAILGKIDDQQELLARAEKYSLKLTELWDEKTGIYRDKNLVTNRFSTQLTPTSFYPLLTETPTQEQAERMINEHLLNPLEFYGDYIIPSIAKNDTSFDTSVQWRGRISGNMNFLIYLGLRNYDLPEARMILAEKSKELLYKGWKTNRRIYESYNPITGDGGDMKGNDSFYTSGGLLALISIMEEGYW